MRENSSSTIRRPASSVSRNRRSSWNATVSTNDALWARPGYASRNSSTTIPATRWRKGPSNPSFFPWRSARRMIRRSTYPRPSLEGTIPSAMRKAVARAWSATTRIAASRAGDFPMGTPHCREIPSRIGRNRSVS